MCNFWLQGISVCKLGSLLVAELRAYKTRSKLKILDTVFFRAEEAKLYRVFVFVLVCVQSVQSPANRSSPFIIWSSLSSSSACWSRAGVRWCPVPHFSGCRSLWPWCAWPGSSQLHRCLDCPEGERETVVNYASIICFYRYSFIIYVITFCDIAYRSSSS